MEQRLALSWNLSSIHGWGVFGLNLVQKLLEKADRGWPRPLLLADTSLGVIDPALHSFLSPLLAERQRIIGGSRHMEKVGLIDTVMLHSSGNDLALNETSRRFSGSRNIGFTFFETTDISDAAIESAGKLDGMRTGSNWNRDYLRDRGLGDVECVHQGVDTARFQPGQKSGRFADRFVVFSGGKLEFRKGQDLVLAAFKNFQQTHPDALLLTVWQNPWPESIASIDESPHLASLPRITGDPAQDIVAWSTREGVATGSHIDLGAISNAQLPKVLADADVAVFPNRCEGGTNLALMEAMASGVPCIVSMNSGHLDIATDENCFPLFRQSRPVNFGPTRQPWGESDVDEIVHNLERVYTDRETASRRSAQAIDHMKRMSWGIQIEKLINSLR